MSRIDDLIEELCPDGVRHVSLSDVASYSDTRVDASRLDGTSFVGVDNLVANKGGRVDSSYPPNTARLTAYEPGDILIGNIRPYLKKVWRVTGEGGCSGDVLALRICTAAKAILDSEFLYYLLSSDDFFAYDMQHAKGAKMPRGNKAAILNYRIPIPPLEVQREIVRVLDQFTQLEAELEAELEARRKQYEYYRDELLAFSGDHNVRWVAMGKVGSFTRGRRFTRKDMVEQGIPCIHYGEIYTHYGTYATETQSFVRDGLDNGLRYAQPGDVVIACVGETVPDVGKSLAWIGNSPVAIHDDCFSFHSSLDPKYVVYVMQTVVFGDQKAPYVSRAKVKRLSGESLARIIIPIPPRDVQKQVVEVLDQFDSLVNDISVGLPAEIAARRKQYEYYRDKLLTFKELEAAA